MILELSRLSQCYVYRCYYDKLSRHQYLKIKRDPHCLWSHSLKSNNETNYYRIINFDHNIINSKSELIRSFVPEVNSRKRKNDLR